MIGKLKSKEVRTVRQKKVLRVTLDFPLSDARNHVVDDRELLPYLDSRVGENIGVNFTVIENEGQMTLQLEATNDDE